MDSNEGKVMWERMEGEKSFREKGRRKIIRREGKEKRGKERIIRRE